jgi:hypothetical protein
VIVELPQATGAKFRDEVRGQKWHWSLERQRNKGGECHGSEGLTSSRGQERRSWFYAKLRLGWNPVSRTEGSSHWGMGAKRDTLATPNPITSPTPSPEIEKTRPSLRRSRSRLRKEFKTLSLISSSPPPDHQVHRAFHTSDDAWTIGPSPLPPRPERHGRLEHEDKNRGDGQHRTHGAELEDRAEQISI